MCISPILIRLPEGSRLAQRYRLGLQSTRQTPVPCGKCAECLAKRQNDVMIRAYREACKARSVHFITFTYTEEDVPIAMSIRGVDTTTGRSFKITEPEVLSRQDEIYGISRGFVTALSKGPRIWTFPLYRKNESINITDIFKDKLSVTTWQKFFDEVSIDPLYEYEAAFTTALYPRDVRLAIKRLRTYWKRKNHSEIPQDFKYLLVGEYGSKNTMRPHYHMLCYNLTDEQADFLAGEWNYGDVQVKRVAKTNEDGSNGFQLVSKYLGKYSAKGSFNNPAYLDGYVPRTRLCTSVGFGTTDIPAHIIDWHLGKDIVQYDANDIESLQALAPDVKEQLISTIRRRLTYEIPYVQKDKNTGEKKLSVAKYALPLSLQRKIFNYSFKNGYATWNAIYYMVKDAIRDDLLDHNYQEFKEFISDYERKDYSLACAKFDYFKKADLLAREEAKKEAHIKFYSKSKF